MESLNKLSEAQKEEIELKTVEYFESIRLLNDRNNRACSKLSCDSKQMSLAYRKNKSTSTYRTLCYRCRKCRTSQSLYDGTFFSLFHKRLYDILFIIKCWSMQLTITKTVELAKHVTFDFGSECFIDLYDLIRILFHVIVSRQKSKPSCLANSTVFVIVSLFLSSCSTDQVTSSLVKRETLIETQDDEIRRFENAPSWDLDSLLHDQNDQNNRLTNVESIINEFHQSTSEVTELRDLENDERLLALLVAERLGLTYVSREVDLSRVITLEKPGIGTTSLSVALNIANELEMPKNEPAVEVEITSARNKKRMRQDIL